MHRSRPLLLSPLLLLLLLQPLLDPLSAQPSPTTLTLRSFVDGEEVPGALVYLDGALQAERTPVTFAVAAGTSLDLRIVLSPRAGRAFAPATTRLVVTDGPGEWRAELGEQSGPVTGRAWTVPGIDLALAALPAGSFRMGSDREGTDERRHTVRLTRPFWMGVHEVQLRHFRRFVDRTRYRTSAEREGYRDTWRRTPTDRHPVTFVSWFDAVAFCTWLTSREQWLGRLPEGYEYRVPTEAEWEYGCRAGSDGEFHGPPDEVGWYAGNSGGAAHPVGEKAPNAWGLRDVHGNVWEWCLDACRIGERHRLETGTYEDGAVDPVETEGDRRVLRGGGWSYGQDRARAANRSSCSPALRSGFDGFRIVLAPVLSRG